MPSLRDALASGGNITITAPSGISLLYFNHGTQGGGFSKGSYFDPTASASSTLTPSGSVRRGTIALEINHD